MTRRDMDLQNHRWDTSKEDLMISTKVMSKLGKILYQNNFVGVSMPDVLMMELGVIAKDPDRRKRVGAILCYASKDPKNSLYMKIGDHYFKKETRGV